MNHQPSATTPFAKVDLAITDVIAHPVTQTVERAVTSWGAYDKVSMVLIEVQTDAGITGVGECLGRFAPEAYAEAVRSLYRPKLIGKNPLDIGKHAAVLRRSLSGRAGGMAQEAVAGVDIALWDILGKVAGLPIYRLLGGVGRQLIDCYASSVGWVDGDEAQRDIEGFLALGFKSIKIKTGLSVPRAIKRIEQMRKIAGDGVGLSVDANWAYSVEQAMVVGRALEANGYEWFEEPIRPEDTDGYRRLAEKLDVPLACGESDFNADQSLPLVRDRVISVIQPDVSRSGGITETSKIARLADAFDVQYAPHVGFSGIVCEMASLHLAAAAPNLRAFECCNTGNHFREIGDIGPGITRLVDGKVPVPNRPGLGIEIDWDKVRAIH